ncbi:MAG: helix-turn-helix domain-containing protein [Pseudomonadota bacterium]
MIDMAHPAPTRAPITAKRIIEIVAKHTDVSVDDMTGPRRHSNLVTARHLAAALIRQWRPDLSYPQIGRLFGGRDHSTIIHGRRAIMERVKRDPDLAQMVHDAEIDVVYEAFFSKRGMLG